MAPSAARTSPHPPALYGPPPHPPGPRWGHRPARTRSSPRGAPCGSPWPCPTTRSSWTHRSKWSRRSSGRPRAVSPQHEHVAGTASGQRGRHYLGEGQEGSRRAARRPSWRRTPRKQERAAFVEPDGNNEDVRDGAREYRQRADDSGCTHATLASSATVTTMRSSTLEKDATTSTGPDDKSTRPQDMLPASKAVSVSTTRAKAAHLTKEWPSTQAREPPREVQQT